MTSTGRSRHLVVLAAGYLSSLVAYSRLSTAYLSSAPLSRLMVAFLLPTTAAVIYALFRSLGARESKREAADAVQAIVFWILVFVITLNALVLVVLAGVQWIQPWAGRSVVILVGLVLLVVGNLLPRTRPNVAVGIRTTRTLTDRRLWMLTHRISGYILVAVGSVTAFSGAFLTGPNIRTFTSTAVLAGATVMGACYWRLSRRQIQRA